MRLAFCLCLLGWGSLGFTQELTLSPYSRYGIGDLFNNTTTRNAAMGGIGIATDNYFTVNRLNPASYADAAFTTFDVSGFTQFSQLRTEEQSEDQSSAGFQNIAFMFPSNGNFTLTFGFSPYSVVGYDITTENTIEVEGLERTERLQYQADGGLNQAFIGGAFKLLDQRLRLGFNGHYTFGSTRYTRIASIPEDSPVIGAREVTLLDETYLRGFGGQLGLMYVDSLKNQNGTFFRIGATVEYNGDLTGDRLLTSDNVLVLDTLINEEGAASMPLKYGAGVSVSKAGKWIIGADVTFQDWSQFEFFSDSPDLGSELRMAAGGEITPNFASNKYLKRISYRLGAYLKQSYITFSDESVSDMGITFGFGFPPSQKGTNQFNRHRLYSKAHLSFILGKRGAISEAQPLEEFYARIRIGINLSDTWFVRRVVD